MRRIRDALFDHRRPVAAALAALAVLAGLQSLQPDDAGRPTLVAARDLDSGQVLATDDLRTVEVPDRARPDGVLDRSAAVGRRVAGPMRAGEPVTDRRVIDPRDLSGHGPDATLTTIRLDEPAALAGVRVGDVVDVVATVLDDETPARVVAEGATVAIVPTADDGDESTTVGLVTTRDDALALAAAGLEARLGLLVSA